MEKLLLLICLTIFTFGYSQEEKQTDLKKIETKENTLLVVADKLQVSNESLLNKESNMEVSFFVPFDDSINTKFNLSPFYHFYFGKKSSRRIFC